MILAYVRSSTSGLNGIAIAVASSGIAALLMSGGRTAHSRFKIPLKLIENATLNINKQSDLTTLIRDAKVILWDEAPMLNKIVYEAVDRTFKDLLDNDKPFGGKVVVLGGDFRQILPVIVRGTREQIVNVCLSKSILWKDI
jgi:ATP-dependent DNA helicase PIF1